MPDMAQPFMTKASCAVDFSSEGISGAPVFGSVAYWRVPSALLSCKCSFPMCHTTIFDSSSKRTLPPWQDKFADEMHEGNRTFTQNLSMSICLCCMVMASFGLADIVNLPCSAWYEMDTSKWNGNLMVWSGIQYDASVKSPSGGIKESALSRSNRCNRTHGWKETSFSTSGLRNVSSTSGRPLSLLFTRISPLMPPDTMCPLPLHMQSIDSTMSM
mmetsp:Transcript_58880/g.164482  ORF Transcript_58880/g.164482 Transcript_58880/m.164482 type:complete len:215 (+) Transcript_58880:184-828(+)